MFSQINGGLDLVALLFVAPIMLLCFVFWVWMLIRLHQEPAAHRHGEADLGDRHRVRPFCWCVDLLFRRTQKLRRAAGTVAVGQSAGVIWAFSGI